MKMKGRCWWTSHQPAFRMRRNSRRQRSRMPSAERGFADLCWRDDHAASSAGRFEFAAASGIARTFAIEDSGARGIRSARRHAAGCPDMVSLEWERDCHGEPTEGAEAEGAGEKSESCDHD